MNLSKNLSLDKELFSETLVEENIIYYIYTFCKNIEYFLFL
jgi:hypothetical protein